MYACTRTRFRRLLGHRPVRHESNIRPLGCHVDPRGPGYGQRKRDGAPLPGRPPAQVPSQLTYRVFGPLQPSRTGIVLDYHGLLDHPASSLVQTGPAPGHHPHRLQQRRHRPSRRQPTPAVGAADRRGDQGVRTARRSPGRIRTAATLGLAPTAALDEPAPMDSVPAGHLTAARAATPVLAAVGPLDLSALAAVVTRSRRFRS
jgi:hypothetical protein